MKDLDKITAKAKATGTSIVLFVNNHRTILLISLACFAVIASVMQAQSYLNPVRNEAKYTELSSGITAKKLNKEIIEKLEKTQLDKDNNVSSNFAPNRNNPFIDSEQ